MIAIMIDRLRIKVENFLDWIADSLVEFDLEFDDEPFDKEEL